MGRNIETRNAYMRDWSKANPGYYKQYGRNRRERNKRILEGLKKECLNCGYSKCPRALDFHHRDGEDKFKILSRLVQEGWSEEKLLAEVAKCDVLCSNCHREHHCEDHCG